MNRLELSHFNNSMDYLVELSAKGDIKDWPFMAIID